MTIDFTPDSKNQFGFVEDKKQPDSAAKLAQKQAALAQSQAVAEKAFATPLSRIQKGDSEGNLDVAKGALKQGAKDLSMAGAQNAGPVGKATRAELPLDS